MKCPHCKSDAHPNARGPYHEPHAGNVVYMACPDCDAMLGVLPVIDTQPKPAEVQLPRAA